MKALIYNSLLTNILFMFAFGLFNINISLGNDVTRDYRGSKLDRGENCGISKTHTSYRIMRGMDADLGEFPWMAALFYKSKFNSSKFITLCGGSIIHESYILTAAHCCHNNLSFVRVGEYDLTKDPDCQDGICAPPHKDLKIKQYARHHTYIYTPENEEHYHDICLIKLIDPLVFNDYVFPICLPLNSDRDIIKYDTRFIAAGWGFLDEKHKSNILQKLTQPYVPNSECQQAWKHPDVYDAIQICAGMEWGKHICPGDSGGPLMAHSTDNGRRRIFLAGVTSYGSNCFLDDKHYKPEIYLRVAHYIPWILINMW